MENLINKRLSEMTLEEKLGHIVVCRPADLIPEEKEYIFDKLRRGCVGAMQCPVKPGTEHITKEVLDTATNDILICADMETGFPLSARRLPSVMGIAATDDKTLAYEFGRITAIEAKAHGFNMVWGPVVDMIDGDAECKVQRTMGTDAEKVTEFATEIARGYLDEGMVFTAKHFPGGSDKTLDGHMFNVHSEKTEEELIARDLVPYIEMNKKGILTGIMVGHTRFPKIDPVYPATLSEKLISIIRKLGFDGLLLTDSFAMMSIINEFGEEGCLGRAIQAGNDMIIPNYHITYKETLTHLENAYNKGVITPERLDEAVRRVLRLQLMAKKEASQKTLSAENIASLDRLNSDSVCTITDDGVDASLDKNKNYLFVVLTENLYKNENGEYVEISVRNSWHPEDIKAQIKEEFPNSKIMEMSEFPHFFNIHDVCYEAAHSDGVVFVTFCKGGSYVASDGLTNRVVHTMEALADRIEAVMHIGNPYAMERIPHVPRLVIGFSGGECEKYAIEILAGKRRSKGKLHVKIKTN